MNRRFRDRTTRRKTESKMARLPYLSPSTAATEEVASELEQLPPLHIFGLVAHAEDAFGPWWRPSSASLNDGLFGARKPELAILHVAALSPGAGYEWEQHERIAREVGLTDAKILAIDPDEPVGVELMEQLR